MLYDGHGQPIPPDWLKKKIAETMKLQEQFESDMKANSPEETEESIWLDQNVGGCFAHYRLPEPCELTDEMLRLRDEGRKKK